MASRSWNRVELIGNLTRDPELRYTPNGAAVCSFGMATNRTYVTEGERKEEADFHRIVAWNKLAELCNQLLKKGNKVFVSGRLQTRSWEGQDGEKKTITEIVVEDMILLTPRTNGEPMAVPDDLNIGSVKTKEEPKQRKTSEKPVDVPNVAEAAAKGEETKKSTSENPPKEEVEDDLPF